MEPAPLRLRLAAATASVVITIVLFQCVALLGADGQAERMTQARGAASPTATKSVL